MGWNESMAYVRLLVRQRVPFALTRYGDGELRILNRTAEANNEWSWDPDTRGAGLFWSTPAIAHEAGGHARVLEAKAKSRMTPRLICACR
eukprot:3166390-Rhodomonas_salina.2